MANQYTKRKLKFTGYKQVQDENKNLAKMWEFLFEKVIELRSERAKKSQLKVAHKQAYDVPRIGASQ